MFNLSKFLGSVQSLSVKMKNMDKVFQSIIELINTFDMELKCVDFLGL